MSFQDLNQNEKKQLLINAQLDTFISLCETNKEFYNLCYEYPDSENIFEGRSKLFYPQYLKIKCNLTWKQYYTKLVMLDNLSKFTKHPIHILVEEGRIFELTTKAFGSTSGNQRNEMFSIAVQTAAYNNKLSELQWLYDFANLLPHQEAIDQAASNGSLDVLRWLALFSLYPSKDGLNLAVQYGKLNVIEWADNLGIGLLPYPQIINSAISNGYIDLVQWLFTHYSDIYKPNIQRYGLNGAAYNGKLEMLKWLYSINPIYLPNSYGAKGAVEKNRLEVVQWLASLNPPYGPVLPTQEEINDVVITRGKNSSVLWLETLNPPLISDDTNDQEE